MAEKIDIEASKNEDRNKLAVSDLNKRLRTIHLGGGEKRIAKQHEQGKMTARERIDAR
jgi:acetyl-CoA carboxylase carboxyltransferase component